MREEHSQLRWWAPLSAWHPTTILCHRQWPGRVAGAPATRRYSHGRHAHRQSRLVARCLSPLFANESLPFIAGHEAHCGALPPAKHRHAFLECTSCGGVDMPVLPGPAGWATAANGAPKSLCVNCHLRWSRLHTCCVACHVCVSRPLRLGTSAHPFASVLAAVGRLPCLYVLLIRAQLGENAVLLRTVTC